MTHNPDVQGHVHGFKVSDKMTLCSDFIHVKPHPRYHGKEGGGDSLSKKRSVQDLSSRKRFFGLLLQASKGNKDSLKRISVSYIDL